MYNLIGVIMREIVFRITLLLVLVVFAGDIRADGTDKSAPSVEVIINNIDIEPGYDYYGRGSLTIYYDNLNTNTNTFEFIASYSQNVLEVKSGMPCVILTNGRDFDDVMKTCLPELYPTARHIVLVVVVDAKLSKK